jgi:hypothetical protein
MIRVQFDIDSPGISLHEWRDFMYEQFRMWVKSDKQIEVTDIQIMEFVTTLQLNDVVNKG